MDDPIEIPTPEMLRAEANLRLQAEVDRIKELERQGKRTPLANAQERHDKLMAVSCGMLSVGAAIKEALPILENLAIRAKQFSQEWRDWWCKNYEVTICEEHNEPLLVNESASIEKSWINRSNHVVWIPCPICEKEKISSSETARWIRMGIPQKVLHATFENFECEEDSTQKKQQTKFINQSLRAKGFILAVGSVGTGKTHLAAATIKAAKSGIFVTFHDLIGELRQTYSENSGQDSMVERYRTCKVLVVDELSTDIYNPDEKKSLDIPPLLYRILGYRHDHDLLTVITSNHTLAVVLAILGPKLVDRMTQSYAVANFTWESHRKSNNAEQ